MNNEIAKRTLFLRTCLDNSKRRFIYSSIAEDSFQKMYQYLDADRKLLRFAEDSMGTISDCYILYAIAQLGITDRQTLQIMLRNLKMRAPDLNIEDMSDDSSVKRRLSTLYKSGLLFVVEYKTQAPSNREKASLIQPYRLYTIDKEAQNLMNMKLSKRLPYNNWLQAKLLPGMIGWACAAYAGVAASLSKYFVEYLDGAFRNKYLGVYYFPCELKFQIDDIPAYVAVIEAFLYHDTRTQTKADFDQVRVTKINAIKNYIFARSKKGPAYVIVVVQDNADLVDMARLIIETEVVKDCLENVFFTGEGIIRELDSAQGAFLQMVLTDEETAATPFDFVAAEPPFIA